MTKKREAVLMHWKKIKVMHKGKEIFFVDGGDRNKEKYILK